MTEDPVTASPDLARRRPDLAGRRIVVTGASRGIGTVVCRELAERGAQLALVGRDGPRLEEVSADLPGGPHDTFVLDVTNEEGWRSASERLAPAGLVHGIVTAAGELGPIGPIGSWDVKTFRRTIDVNVVGTLLPVVVLMDRLRAAGGAVVTFSGGGGTTPLPRYDAYAASKAAVVRLTENLASELEEAGVRINCIAPGFVPTSIHDATLAAGPELAGSGYYDRTRRALDAGESDSPELAANLAAWLLSDDAAGITGKLISARWDPWRIDDFRERLRRDPDLATLRRIDHQFFVAEARPPS